MCCSVGCLTVPLLLLRCQSKAGPVEGDPFIFLFFYIYFFFVCFWRFFLFRCIEAFSVRVSALRRRRREFCVQPVQRWLDFFPFQCAGGHREAALFGTRINVKTVNHGNMEDALFFRWEYRWFSV